MQPEAALWKRTRRSDRRDGDRRGVRRDHRTVAAHLVERGDQLALGADLLDDRLDHELASGQRREITHEREARERSVALPRAALPFLHAPREARLDARACTLERGIVDIATDDLAATLEQDLRDAGPHGAQPYDSDASDCFHARERYGSTAALARP